MKGIIEYMRIKNSKNKLLLIFIDFLIIIMFIYLILGFYDLSKEMYIRNSRNWVKVNADITNRTLHTSGRYEEDAYYIEYKNINKKIY